MYRPKLVATPDAEKERQCQTSAAAAAAVAAAAAATAVTCHDNTGRCDEASAATTLSATRCAAYSRLKSNSQPPAS